jgi:hypothetical protein
MTDHDDSPAARALQPATPPIELKPDDLRAASPISSA